MTTPAPAPSSSRFQGARDLRLIGRQTRYEQLAFWRNPVGAAFTVGFSLVFLVLLGAAAGNQRVSYLGGVRLVQYYVPGFVAYGVMAACFNMLAISLVNRRETGLLKRLRLSPLPAWALVVAILLSTAVICAVQVALVLVVGRVGFSVAFPRAPGPFLLTLVVGALSFSAMGVGIATVVPNQDAVGPVVGVVFYVLLFLSGLWFPLKPGSGLARFSAWFPMRHFIQAVFTTSEALPKVSVWPWHDLGVVALWGVVGAFVARRRFSWSPRR